MVGAPKIDDFDHWRAGAGNSHSSLPLLLGKGFHPFPTFPQLRWEPAGSQTLPCSTLSSPIYKYQRHPIWDVFGICGRGWSRTIDLYIISVTL